MSLFVDTPRWAWRGHLWAHLISDESLDELHGAGRQLGLRWLSFGRDHYDVPDVLWPRACELAQLVDSREIVRSLRRSGLRVGGGKPIKSWRRIDDVPQRLITPSLASWRRQIEHELGSIDIEVLHRPGEWVVLHLLNEPLVPDLPALRNAPAGAANVVCTNDAQRASIELVIVDR